jgi:hypothetical protein
VNVRPPRILTPRPELGPLDALQYEVLQEKAATLSRMVQNFEEALSALKSFAGDDAERREGLLDAAGEALWFLVVQREACGLSNTEAMLRTYDVPPAVRLRMGPARRGKSASRNRASR